MQGLLRGSLVLSLLLWSCVWFRGCTDSVQVEVVKIKQQLRNGVLNKKYSFSTHRWAPGVLGPFKIQPNRWKLPQGEFAHGEHISPSLWAAGGQGWWDGVRERQRQPKAKPPAQEEEEEEEEEEKEHG